MVNHQTAFPIDPRLPGNPRDFYGMTLRDYFAGQALAGLMSACDSTGIWTSPIDAAAKASYAAADAMLAEREKGA